MVVVMMVQTLLRDNLIIMKQNITTSASNYDESLSSSLGLNDLLLLHLGKSSVPLL